MGSKADHNTQDTFQRHGEYYRVDDHRLRNLVSARGLYKDRQWFSVARRIANV